MKKSILIATIAITAIQFSACAQNTKTKTEQTQTVQQTDTIKVYGNCGMCKNRIEGALKNVHGIQSASWNVETKMLVVSYDSSKVSLDEIHQKVADVGHDTEKIKAKDEVYNNLMGCCQYERPKTK